MAKKKAVIKPVSRAKSVNGLELVKLKMLTPAQYAAQDLYGQGRHLFLDGVAGAGKSFCALGFALSDYLSMKTGSIKIVRSTVPSRDMGFMPGTLEEKLSVYESPYEQIVNKLFGRDDAWMICKQKGIIELVSTSYLRGQTFDNCIVIFDEVQNCTISEISTMVTRTGNNCRLILCGDYWQDDLKDKKQVSGFKSLSSLIAEMPSFATVTFGVGDIVRSGVVAEFIRARAKLGI